MAVITFYAHSSRSTLHVKLSERLSVTLRYLATGTMYEKYTVNHIL